MLDVRLRISQLASSSVFQEGPRPPFRPPLSSLKFVHIIAESTITENLRTSLGPVFSGTSVALLRSEGLPHHSCILQGLSSHGDPPCDRPRPGGAAEAAGDVDGEGRPHVAPQHPAPDQELGARRPRPRTPGTVVTQWLRRGGKGEGFKTINPFAQIGRITPTICVQRCGVLCRTQTPPCCLDTPSSEPPVSTRRIPHACLPH